MSSDSALGVFNSGNSFVNSGTVQKTAGTGTSSLTIDFQNAGGTVKATSGTLALTRIDFSSTSTVGAGGGVVQAPELHVTGPTTVASGGTLTFTGGVPLDGSATLSVAGTMRWQAGVMVGSGITQVSSGGVLAISGSGAKTLQNTRQLKINTGGTITWPARRPRSGGTASIDNAGTLDSQGDARSGLHRHRAGHDQQRHASKDRNEGPESNEHLRPAKNNGGTLRSQCGFLSVGRPDDLQQRDHVGAGTGFVARSAP